jgi:hypothetical protein
MSGTGPPGPPRQPSAVLEATGVEGGAALTAPSATSQLVVRAEVHSAESQDKQQSEPATESLSGSGAGQKVVKSSDGVPLSGEITSDESRHLSVASVVSTEASGRRKTSIDSTENSVVSTENPIGAESCEYFLFRGETS